MVLFLSAKFKFLSFTWLRWWLCKSSRKSLTQMGFVHGRHGPHTGASLPPPTSQPRPLRRSFLAHWSFTWPFLQHVPHRISMTSLHIHLFHWVVGSLMDGKSYSYSFPHPSAQLRAEAHTWRNCCVGQQGSWLRLTSLSSSSNSLSLNFSSGIFLGKNSPESPHDSNRK